VISVENLKIFPPTSILCPRWRELPLELGISAWGQKTRVMGLRGRISLMISSAVWTQYTNVTDRQTETGWQQRPLTHSVER